MSESMKYVVIIGDIIASRNIEDREHVQKNFIKVLETINKQYELDVAANFIITAGDEFQGLLKSTNNIMNIINTIDMLMYPVKFRYGIGVGPITSTIQRNKSNEVDGPAYHRARNMISCIENNERSYQKPYTTMMIESEDFEDDLLNANFSLISTLKQSWTHRQTEIVYAYLSNEKNQYNTATALNVQQSTINRLLSAASYYTYDYAMALIINYFRQKEVD